MEEAADNLVAIANALDESVHGDAAALAISIDRAREGDRVLHDLVEAVRALDDRARLRDALDRLHDDADELRRLERA